MKRILMFATLVLIPIAFVLIVWPIVRVNQVSSDFSSVKDNEGSQSVLQCMGAPWKDEECGKYLGGKPAGCVHEFIYAHPYAPYVPEYWVIRFDSNNRVMSKVHLISP